MSRASAIIPTQHWDNPHYSWACQIIIRYIDRKENLYYMPLKMACEALNLDFNHVKGIRYARPALDA